MSTNRPPLPPFRFETAVQKVRMAEDAWNSHDPDRVALAYTEDSRWRNRSEFFQGRKAITEFLKRKRGKELDYRLEGVRRRPLAFARKGLERGRGNCVCAGLRVWSADGVRNKS